ncbi:MAG TPA: protein kinase [Ktedonobacteraceae bacterium]|jgi:serine/threonine protein kinase|nr:protein kinase [Ktedonobacteraceae bacterium]
MLALEGRQLGNYDVVRRIRVGGMGAVYEGRQRTAFGRRVAIKVILGNYASDREMRRRFAREAQTIAQLHHPHILPLIEFGDERGLLYLVMPFIEGGTLTSYLRHALPDLNEVAAIFLQLLDAVEYAHEEGLIHRDIKSSNVLLDLRRSGPPYVYLADFGLVRTSQQAEVEQGGKPIPLEQVPGTPHYMAPEQTRGIVTTSTDIYALGVLLYQMLVGELPYNDPDEVKVIKMHLYAPVPSPCDRDASIPFELGEVAQTAMAKRPEARYSSIAELREAFLASLKEPIATIDEDDPPFEDIALPLQRHVSVPLVEPEPQQIPPPAPVPVQRPQPRRPVRSISRGMQQIGQRARASMKVKKRRFALTVTAATLVPALLLLVLVIPRVFGFSLLPAAVPIQSASPDATILVTLQSKTLQNTFILTASPHTQEPDAATRVIPDHIVQATSADSRTVQTTGEKTLPGTQANGSLLFDNSSHTDVFVTQGMTFTASSGVQITVTQPVNVPGRHNGQDGMATASARAVQPGAAGNIQAGALSTNCCNGQVMVSNPAPFEGGTDPQQVHVVAQADIDTVTNALSGQLRQQAMKQLQSQLAAGDQEAGQPSFTTKVVADNPAGSQANQVTVQVSVSATALVYNVNMADQVAEQLLSKQAAQDPGKNYHLLKGSISFIGPIGVQQAQNDILYLSVTVHGLWVYNITSQQINTWRQDIKGLTPAQATVHLSTQPGVISVQIQLPFGTDRLPVSANQIRVQLVTK